MHFVVRAKKVLPVVIPVRGAYDGVDVEGLGLVEVQENPWVIVVLGKHHG
jgi:hypothetical protein